MASKAAHKRLSKEYLAMQKSSPPYVYAAPDEKNILTWNFIVRGPPDGPYAGGEYHGVLMFPSEYPFKPPGIKVYTPSGRFQPDKKICFSMSDFHPGSWNPAWSVATICTGVLSFMLSDEMTTGSMNSTDAEKRALALQSHGWNRQNKKFKDAFPEYCGETMTDLPNMGEQDRGVADGAKTAATPTQTVRPSAPTSAPAPVALRPTPVLVPGTGPSPVNGGEVLGWTASWKKTMWDRWGWGVVIMFAVVVSRLST